MREAPFEEVARLAPFLRAWEEVQNLCRSLTGGAAQLIPIQWDASEEWEALDEALCPSLSGARAWKTESQSFHYRHFVDLLCAGTEVTVAPCYCGLSHFVFPLRRDGAVVGAVVSSAIRTAPAEISAITALSERAARSPSEALDFWAALPEMSETLEQQARELSRKVRPLADLLARTRNRESSQESAPTPQKTDLAPSSSLEQEARPAPEGVLSPQLEFTAIPHPVSPTPKPSGKRRVVVTGIGVVSPVAVGKDAFREAIRLGKNGVGPITLFEPNGMNSKIGGEVRDFHPEEYMDPRTIKRTGRSTQFAVGAARQAIQDAKVDPDDADMNRVGVIIGSAAGGLEFGQDQVAKYLEDGGKAISPFLSIIIFAGACSSEVSMELGAKGPSITVSTGCAASNDAFGYGLQLIRDNKADIILAGGTEAPIFPVMHASFCALRALSTRNNDPEHASRPFDRDRDGFVIAEGSAMLVLEELDHARARGAHIYGEIHGYAATGDAFHMTRPSPDGADATRAIQLALQDSNIIPSDVQYISAHGSGTPLNDRTETAAIKSVFGKHAYNVPVSSTKSMLGHSIGASGAFDLAAVFLGMQSSFLPPTMNLEIPDPECDLDYVANAARDRRFEVALSNTFGFGGKNACVVVSKW